MARVVVAAAYGGPEVLEIIEVPAGAPGPGQALVEVKAAGVNPIDYKQYSGAFGADPARLPMRLGFEVSGVVTEVGPDAIGPAGPVSAGDEVIGYRVDGGYASELIVPAGSLTPKPASLDWAPAAGLMLTGATAWHCLAATDVTGGDTVLIHGGSGGVGTVAVQLAVGRGATVIATASPARHEFLRELGAIPVTYGAGLADRVRAAAPGGVDVAIDMIGTEEAIDVSRELVADHDRIVTIVASARSRETGTRALGGGPGADPGTATRQAARPELARLVGEGSLRVFVSETFPLADAAQAHRAISTKHAFGKIVLVP
jgi:NADPH:quinone reductase